MRIIVYIAPPLYKHMTKTIDKLTPIEYRGGYYFKRDDYFKVAGVCGGKARTCWALAQPATRGLVTAGSRFSPQCKIVAHIAHVRGLACHIHTTKGELTPELNAAIVAGAHVYQHKPGYNSVIVKRAKDDARDNDFTLIPFGMECRMAVEQTARQVKNMPSQARRLVIPVGSGMSLAGVLYGLLRLTNLSIPVVGVCVGAAPEHRLDKYALPLSNWRSFVTLIRSQQPYHEHHPVPHIAGVQLDPIYEAKCLPYLEPGDLLWVVGIR
jgi:1-aminocyclopropane-1-carboxylate deaminase/D-cysteine desulfhydrase-like pyridoxal-dependent ACC family enzyme